MQCIQDSETNRAEYDYAGVMGVNDTALEVRRGRQDGVSILGIFTGSDEDFPAAKKIYGHNLVHIKSSERFADTVGVMLENELNNMYD
jgi:nitric oxide reductase activation protein